MAVRISELSLELPTAPEVHSHMIDVFGDPKTLKTVTKDDLVSAINEVYDLFEGIKLELDYVLGAN